MKIDWGLGATLFIVLIAVALVQRFISRRSNGSSTAGEELPAAPPSTAAAFVALNYPNAERVS